MIHMLTILLISKVMKWQMTIMQGVVGLLAKMYQKYGGNPIPNFNAIEEVGQEYEVEAAIVASGISFINLRVTLMNKTAWPPRASDKLSAKYFVDISETIKAGLTPDDIRVSASTPGVKVSGLKPWDKDKNILCGNRFDRYKIYSRVA